MSSDETLSKTILCLSFQKNFFLEFVKVMISIILMQEVIDNFDSNMVKSLNYDAYLPLY